MDDVPVRRVPVSHPREDKNWQYGLQ